MATPLTSILETYSVLRPISPGARYNLQHAIDQFGRYITHEPTTDDLADTTVSGYIQSLENSCAQRTIRCRRNSLKTVWRFAHKRGLAQPVGDIRPAPIPDPDPQVWSLDELRRLLAACVLLDCGQYFHALLLFSYESGLRRSDCWTVKRCQIADDGRVALTMKKTQRCHVCQVRPETAAAVLALDGDPPLAWPESPATFYRRFAKLRRLANVGPGALQQCRRTGATEIARCEGLASASAFLGHRSPGMVAFYVARSVLARPHLPPAVA